MVCVSGRFMLSMVRMDDCQYLFDNERQGGSTSRQMASTFNLESLAMGMVIFNAHRAWNLLRNRQPKSAVYFEIITTREVDCNTDQKRKDTML